MERNRQTLNATTVVLSDGTDTPGLSDPSTHGSLLAAPGQARLLARRLLAATAALVLFLFTWQSVAGVSSPTILPGPGTVASRFHESLLDGTYWPALTTTADEALLGWVVGAAAAIPLGYAIGRLPALDDALAPYLAASQAMPVVAIAPLLVVWAGFGLLPKVIICSLIAFFPMAATTAGGVRGVSRDLRDAARVYGAGYVQMARYVDLPLAARTIFAGIKVAVALSVTGAVVGEFVSADQGLGYLVNVGRTNFDTPLMFVGMLSLMVLGALGYTAVSLIERVVVQWDD